MSHDDFDPSLLIGLHKLAVQNGEGLAPALYERISDHEASLEMIAEVIPLPGLHQRSKTSAYPQGRMAVVIDFPQPRWHRNARRRG